MSSMQSALERALPIVAAAYGQQFGVKVILSGTDACTNGESIVLPMLSDMRGMSDVLFGYLAHESAHIRDSNFAVIGLCTSEIEKSFLNIIEDIRIERMMQELFPGTVETLSAMQTYIVDSGMSPPACAEDSEATQLHQYLLHRLYYESLNREVEKDLFEASDLVVRETFPEGFFVRLDVLLKQNMPKLKDSRDCLILARRILDALKDAEEEERQKQNSAEADNPRQSDSNGDDSSADPSGTQGDSDSGDDGDSGDSGQGDQTADGGDGKTSDGDSGADKTDDGNTPGQPGSDPQSSSDSSSSQDSSGSPGDSDSTQAGNGASAHSRMIQETDLPEDIVSQLRADLSEKAVEDNGRSSSFTLDTDSVGDTVGNTGNVDSLHAGILSSSMIRARLAGLLQAQSRQKEFLHHRGRRVDGKRLTRMVSGDTRVFKKREETKRPDTAVHVLLDASGSMGNIQDIANQAAVSLALAVSSIPKCDIAVSMFPGKGGAVSPMINRGQPVRVNLGRCAVRSSGGTPLAEAMLYAGRELAVSRSERKVLIVITDGAPNDGNSVQYMTKLIEPFVDVYAIGINSTAVRNYFKKNAVINSVEELQSALFSIAGRFLDLH
ncbi:cobaltochelatase CobT-related protein [Zhongshania marina]|uniref:VWA domain-containing protein n=1 Tax=Zhongshania marina TaxID=2304603 RepID=A0A2S4HBZ5_9GAMM|nr:VWA domain-containing protein [Marortus luteolus]POP51503.1 VWA domain-containing protein [Marortus luteolus]